MTIYFAESFYRSQIKASVTKTQTVPFSLKVSIVPTLTTGLLTISPNTENEEIIQYDGVDSTNKTITVIKRGINWSSQALTTNGAYAATGDYNNSDYTRPHDYNDNLNGDVTHLHLIQDGGNYVLKTGDAMTGVLKLSKSANIASSSGDLSAATGNLVHITGTTTITSFGTVQAGSAYVLVLDSTPIIQHSANIILPTGANITATANDVMVVVSEGSGVFRCVSYQRASGLPLLVAAKKATSSVTGGTVAVDCSLYDAVIVSATSALTISAPTGTPLDTQVLTYRILDNGTARAITWNSAFRFSTDLPSVTTTVLGKTLYMAFMWNSTASKWDCVGQLNNF